MNYRQILDYYSREDVQNALLEASKDREVAGIFKNGSFGHRPNVLIYPTDIVNMAKSGTVSFHGSVERWDNPMSLRPGMSREDMDDLRKGFELIIDIDIKDFEFAKIYTKIFFDELTKYGIKNIGVKYTGGKSFHMGIPFESFPEKIDYKPTRTQYPLIPQVIVLYLSKKLKPKLEDALLRTEPDITEMARKLQIAPEKLIGSEGLDISKIFNLNKPPGAGKIISNDPNSPKYEGSLNESNKGKMEGNKATEEFVGKSIAEYGLFTSRHMFRLPYSLHESSFLVSLPIKISDIDKFEKSEAKPENVKVAERFLNSENTDNEEMETLITEAMDWNSSKAKEEEVKKRFIALNSDKIPQEFFPPSIQKITYGLPDGRKRSILILFNFLRNMNWSDDEIENFITEWNQKNTPPLPANYVRGQIRWLRASKKMLPPNFDKENFYRSMGINFDTETKANARNPVTYAIRSFRAASRKTAKKPVKGRRTKEDDGYVVD
ncbi:MAG: hypothetical protein HY051_05985 [Candidatus Aenigmarchaeota archaeon]|nr:hypothetical protein [Candidatus Aenigmarchaeota archaeon]